MNTNVTELAKALRTREWLERFRKGDVWGSGTIMASQIDELLAAILGPPEAKPVAVDWSKAIQFKDGAALENLGRIHTAVGPFNQAVYCAKVDRMYLANSEGVTEGCGQIINTPTPPIELGYEVAVATSKDGYETVAMRQLYDEGEGRSDFIMADGSTYNHQDDAEEDGWHFGTWHHHTVSE